MPIIPTFASWLDENGLSDAPDLSDFDRVTVAWLQYDQAVALRIADMQSDPVAANVRVLFDVLSEDIIDSHFGAGWFAEHVDGSARSPQTRNYLNFDGPPAMRLLAAHRVHELARRLYQLQSFDWFGDLVQKVSTRDLSGAGFELDVVLLLHTLIARVTPTEESGEKGEDYDILLEIGKLVVPVEVKAKDDDTPFSEATVTSTLKGAVRQLPKGSKGIVFMRIPTAWVGPELEAKYPDVIAEALRQTSRVGAVITAVDKMSLNGDATAGSVTRVYHFFKHDDCPDELWEACLFLKELLDRGFTMTAPSPPF